MSVVVLAASSAREVTVQVAADGGITVTSIAAEELDEEARWVRAAPWLKTKGAVSPRAVHDVLFPEVSLLDRCVTLAGVLGFNFVAEVTVDGKVVPSAGFVAPDSPAACVAEVLGKLTLPTNPVPYQIEYWYESGS